MTEQEWRDKQFNQADFDQEHGLLSRMLQEVQRAHRPATTAVQNFLAGEVKNQFVQRYQEYVNTFDRNNPVNIARSEELKFPKPLGYEAFYQKNPYAHDEVFDRPLDLSLAGMTQQPNGGPTPADYFPSAFSVSNVREAVNWLVTSELEGSLVSLARPVYGEKPYKRNRDGSYVMENGQRVPTGEPESILFRQSGPNPADDLNAGIMRGIETIHLYEPGGNNNFTVWYNHQVAFGIKQNRMVDQENRRNSIPTSHLSPGNDSDDFDPGTGQTVSGESGEWGDAPNRELELAGVVGTATRFSTPPIRPDRSAWGIDWNTPGGRRKGINDFFADIQNRSIGKAKSWDTFNVMNRMYGKNSGAANLQVLGVPEDSPAARAGMHSGAFIPALQRILDSPNLGTVVDELLYNNQIDLPVIQKNDQGQLVEQVLHIDTGSQAGRGISDLDDLKEPYWLDRLADTLDRDYGLSVQHVKGQAVKDANGNWTYQRVLLTEEEKAAARTGARSELHTGLFTTSKEQAGGIYRDTQGNWQLADMQEGRSDTHTVPVTLNAETIRNFRGFYEKFSKVWSGYDAQTNNAWRQADQIVTDRYTKAMRENGKYPEKPFAQARRETFERLLPRSVPRPGTEAFSKWQAGAGMLREIREYEKSINGYQGQESFWDRTIEQWDAYSNELEHYKNPGSYGYINAAQLARAQADVSNGGNYLAQSRAMRRANLMDADRIRNGTPGGYDAVSKMNALDPETGELVHRYPEMTGDPAQPFSLDTFEHWVLQQWRYTKPVSVPAPARAAGESYPGPLQDVQQIDYRGVQRGLVQPGEVNARMPELDISRLAQNTNNAYQFPRSPGRTTRMIENIADRKRAALRGMTEPTQRLQMLADTGAMFPLPADTSPPDIRQVPARPTGKYKDPEPRPWYQPPGPNDFPSQVDRSFKLANLQDNEDYANQVFGVHDRIDGLTEAAYSQRSNTNAMSVYPLGSMNEDDFDWNTVDPRHREQKERTESTYDGSMMGGDAEEMVNRDEPMRLDQWISQEKFQPYQVRGADNPTALNPEGAPPLDVIGGLQAGLTFNEGITVEDRKNAEEGIQDVYPIQGGYTGARDGSERAVKGDKVMQKRIEYDRDNPSSPKDDLDGNEETSQGASENAFQNALRHLPDPRAIGASLSAVVSQLGNRRGFLANSKVDWGAFFNSRAHKEAKAGNNATFGTFHALFGKNPAEMQVQDLGAELAANLDLLAQVGRKRSAMLVRLGEKDRVKKSPYYDRGPEFVQEIAMKVKRGEAPAENYRQLLQQIAREEKLTLSWQPGKEEDLYNELETLRTSEDPAMREKYARVSSTFASPGEQLKLSRQYVAKAYEVPAAPSRPVSSQHNTPAPQRGDSHTNQVPGGRNQAKFSRNQIDELRGRGGARSAGFDPVTGEFSPNSLENTPVAAQLAARNGGGVRRDFPKNPDLTDLQNVIYYDQANSGRVVGQVDWFMTHKYSTGERSMFNFIVPEGASDEMIGELHRDAKGAFRAQGLAFSEFIELDDDELPQGYRKFGGYVDPIAQAAPAEPPEAPPPMDNNGSGNSAGAGDPPEEPPPPPGTTTAAPDPGPGPSSNGARTNPTPRPQRLTVNRDPGQFPMQPGAEGWRMTFSRYDPTTRRKKNVTVHARKDSQGNLGWYEKNADGEGEPLRVNKGFGTIVDENGQKLHEVSRNDREVWEGRQMRLREDGAAVSNSGNNGATPAPARKPISDPAEWAQIKPEAGMMMIDRSHGAPRYYHAEENPDSPGEYRWMTRANEGAIMQEAPDPGWGKIVDKDDRIIADVGEVQYQRYAHEQGKAQSVENKRFHEEEKARSDEKFRQLREQRRVDQNTPAPTRSGFSATFGRFNNAMWQISGGFVSKFYQSHSPTEFGEEEYGQNTQIAAMNEYLANVTRMYNDYTKVAPTSAQQIVDDIVDMTGASEEQAKPIAEQLFQAHQTAKAQHRAIKPENPMKRTVDRVSRLDDEYSDQQIGGAMSFRQHAVNKAQEVSMRDIDGFKSPSLGQASFYPYVDERGEQRMIPQVTIDKVNPQTGEKGFQTTVDQNQIAKGLSWAQSAFSSAMSGDLPASPEGIVATLKERMFKELSRQMKADVDNAVQHGQNSVDAGVAANITKEVSDHFVGKIVDKVKGALGVTEGEANGSLVGEGTRYDTRIKSVDDLKAKMAADPVFAREFKGRSAEEVFAGDEMVVFDRNDRSVIVGGSGGRGGSRASNVGNSGPRGSGGMAMMTGNNQAGGMGKFGSLMYGAYLLKREWQMAAGQTLAEASAWGEGQADYAGLIYSGSSLAESDMGFAYRQEVGQNFWGKAAYSSYGGYMDIPYRMAQSGNLGGARLIQQAGISGGIAAGGLIGGAMLAGTAFTGAAPALMLGGAVVGGASLLAVAGMEAYNAWGKPENAPDVTLSTPIDEFQKSRVLAEAAQRRTDALYGKTFEEHILLRHQRGQPALPYRSWKEHKIDDPLNGMGNEISPDELMPYLSDEGKAIFRAEEENKKAEALSQAIKGISWKTAETEDDLKKGAGFQTQLFGEADAQMLSQVSQAAAGLHMTSGESLQQGATYASQMGYLVGSKDFERAAYEFALNPDLAKRQEMQYSAQRFSSMGSQFQSLMGTSGNFAGLGARIAKQYNFQNQAQAGAYTSMVQGLQSQGAELPPWRMEQLANLSQQNSPFVSGVIGNAMEQYMMGGGTFGNAVNMGFALSNVGMSSQDASIYGQMMQGDLHAYSFQAWKSGNMNNAFFDRAGRPIFQTSGNIGMQVYNHHAPGIGLPQMTAAQFLGVNGTPTAGQAQYIQAFQEHGFFGMQRLNNEKSYGASLASIGVQLKGIALQENFYWGANAGGTWDNPTHGSAWGIEDRQLALQDASQRANFADQWTRMNLQNEFSIRRENNQFQRMQVSNNYQNWQWSQQYNQFQQQQQWTQQDWEYQDTMRGLSFGWQMEDLTESIRFASGRERKQLVKQRDRAALTHNIEDEQIDTTRERQKELWAQQEEALQKQREYSLELQRLDQEGFDLNRQQREEFYDLDVQAYNRRMNEYEEEKKLQDELRELQRKFQYDQLQLSKEAAGAQAAAAAAQKEYNDLMVAGQENQEKFYGTMAEANKYDNAFRIATATKEMMSMMNRVDTTRINKLMDLITLIGTVNPQRWGGERD